jgi:signal transduction histidine kinase
MGALLTAAKLDLARVRSRVPATAGNEALQERLDHLNESLNACAAFKRRITEDLLPSSLSHLGLDATLEIQAQEFERRTGIQTELLLDAPPCDSGTNLAIFRLVQESLNNIAKHAQAKRVCITLQAQAQHIDLRIEDDGQGFDPHEALHKSHGLPGMLHRVEALAGKFHVRSQLGGGTCIQAIFPRSSAGSAKTEAI